MSSPSESHILAQLAREQNRGLAQRVRIADLDALVGIAQQAALGARRAADEAIAQARAAESEVVDMQSALMGLSRDIAGRDATIAQLRAEAGDAQIRYASDVARGPTPQTHWLARLLP